MPVEFDKHGYLQPYELIQIDWETFEQLFVNGFPQSKTRKQLFENYQQWVKEMRKILNINFTQWIDGSFVTRKVDPNDIDVVVFVDYEVFKEKRLLFVDRERLKQQSGIDLYFVNIYPLDHSYHFRTLFDEEEWLSIFGFDRKNQPKGFIKLNS